MVQEQIILCNGKTHKENDTINITESAQWDKK